MPLQVIIRKLSREAVERLVAEANATGRVTYDSYRELLVVVGADAKPSPETAELLQTLADADAQAMQEEPCPPKP